MRFLQLCLFGALSIVLTAAAPAATKSEKKSSLSAPLSYLSCGQAQNLKGKPERLISLDINLTEMLLALGLGPKLVAAAGVADEKALLPELRADFAGISKKFTGYPSLEAVLAEKPDFVLGGWNYGFSQKSGLSPERLAQFGISSFVLSESCVHVKTQKRASLSLGDVLGDLRTLGRIFHVENRAEKLEKDLRAHLKAYKKQSACKVPPSVFVFDSGTGTPVTAGALAIPTAIIEAAGGVNIFADLDKSWTSVSWEAVFAEEPDFVLFVQYGNGSIQKKEDFLRDKFKRMRIDVLEKGRFSIMPYAALTPGIRNFSAVRDLAAAFQKACNAH